MMLEGFSTAQLPGGTLRVDDLTQCTEYAAQSAVEHKPDCLDWWLEVRMLLPAGSAAAPGLLRGVSAALRLPTRR